MSNPNKIFENLFILEMANNHLGNMERGLNIIQQYGTIVRYNSVRAALKLQFRDVDSFIHPSYKGKKASRYISKTEATKLTKENYGILVKAIKDVGCIPMATPFDEKSVDLCVEFQMPLLKIASSDINDWPLIEKMASTKLPTLVSSGGASEKNLDDIVTFFENRNIPLAINHCVSMYPSEDHELEINQVRYLRKRYPGHVIGFSTHEYHDWQSSMYVSYALGARTWERHVDIEADDIKVSPYCSLPAQVGTWFKAFHHAKVICGGSSEERRSCSEKEIRYLDDLVRGVYAKRNLEAGYVFSHQTFNDDFYLAIPLQKGQLSCREIITGAKLTKPIEENGILSVHHIDGPCATDPSVCQMILNRGV